MARYFVEIDAMNRLRCKLTVTLLPQNFWNDITELASNDGVYVRVTKISWFGLHRKVIFQKEGQIQ